MRLHYAARSDIGLVRGNNQDSVYAGPHLLAVADGVGGAVAGDVASRTVMRAIAELDRPESDLAAALRGAAQLANDRLAAAIASDPQLSGMGTTLTAILFDGTRLGLLHLGDSRAYLLHNGELSQITHDHTLVQALVDDGEITPEQASRHPHRSVILPTHVLTGGELEADVSVGPAVLGDRFLVCSDGLSDFVADDDIAKILGADEPAAAVDRLIDAALRGGGRDNVSTVVADIVEASSTMDPIVAGAADG